MHDERINRLDSLDHDEGYKLGRTMANEVMTGWRGEMAYDCPVAVYVEGVGTYTLRIESDYDSNPFEDYDCYGSLHWPGRESNERPSGVDGAGRKLDTRSGPVWWQPPADAKGDAELAKRVQRYLRDDWSYVGVVLTLSIPGYEDQTSSVWAVESDCGASELDEIIANLQSDLKTAPEQDAQTLATKLRRWAALFSEACIAADLDESDPESAEIMAAVDEMTAMANGLEPRIVS